METETKNRPHLRLSTTHEGAASLVVPNERSVTGTSTVAALTPDEVQALVQDAYDTWGILAEPSMDVELARVAEANPGLCRCGLPGCSDGDAALREFADRWGQSMRGRA